MTTPASAAAAVAANSISPTFALPLPRRLATRIVLGIIAAAAIVLGVILAARGLTTFTGVHDFLIIYPGEYALPDFAPVGFPAWVEWQHFFSAFLMVLIIRSGWQVRTQKRPSAFWTAKWRKTEKKISLTLWFHQALDLLWVLNGAIFIVLLFVTGQWVRLVPSSWSVFPNAISALLKYLTLEWPTEDGWVNYNSLQQLSYFVTVFIAAPLAIATGVRMSGLWQPSWKRLSRWYPVEIARTIHFPVMLYFVFFIVAHVTLVFATGALRNLNHMYGGQDEINWFGFAIFVVSLIVMGAAWIAARPLVLAPIASRFGRVSSR
ncbi:MAG: cytochrome b/b6 protein [Subtercola sp.]|nr:cytochrome b/b6 protein [Subtercola sp.]